MSQILSGPHPFGPIERTVEMLDKHLMGVGDLLFAGTNSTTDFWAATTRKYRITSVDCNPIVIRLAELKLQLIKSKVKPTQLAKKIEEFANGKLKNMTGYYSKFLTDDEGYIQIPKNEPKFVNAIIGEMPDILKEDKLVGDIISPKKIKKIEDLGFKPANEFDGVLMEGLTQLQDNLYKFVSSSTKYLKNRGKVFVLDRAYIPDFVVFDNTNNANFRAHIWGTEIKGSVVPFEKFMSMFGLKTVEKDKFTDAGNEYKITVFEKVGEQNDEKEILEYMRKGENLDFVNEYNEAISQFNKLKQEMVTELSAEVAKDILVKIEVTTENLRRTAFKKERIEDITKRMRQRFEAFKEQLEIEKNPEKLGELIKQKERELEYWKRQMMRPGNSDIPYPKSLEDEVIRLREKLEELKKSGSKKT